MERAQNPKTTVIKSINTPQNKTPTTFQNYSLSTEPPYHINAPEFELKKLIKIIKYKSNKKQQNTSNLENIE